MKPKWNSIIGQGYTIPVADIVEQIWIDGHPEEPEEIETWKEGLERIEEHIEYASGELFYFDYPYYGDTTDKEALQIHILETYYTRDICCDSMMRWVLYLKDRLNDIMPKYVALYNAQVQLIASEILNPYHIQETKDVTSNKTLQKNTESSNEAESQTTTTDNSTSTTGTSGTDATTDNSVNKFSNTPQAMASAVASGTDIQLSYLSNMTVNTDETENNYESSSVTDETGVSEGTRRDTSAFESTDTSTESKLDTVVRDIKGNLSRMNNAQLIKDYQDVILNIEKMITDDLKDLFYLVY